ncbi:MAG: hypothetical protein GY714_26655 [Desulfobacterales bacterium]|nr:hypothetical protein [Desulfobacterales bacterium]MCP4159473.1 hypothetical protein [Deltaproteobacteria bacterium]
MIEVNKKVIMIVMYFMIAFGFLWITKVIGSEENVSNQDIKKSKISVNELSKKPFILSNVSTVTNDKIKN